MGDDGLVGVVARARVVGLGWVVVVVALAVSGLVFVVVVVVSGLVAMAGVVFVVVAVARRAVERRSVWARAAMLVLFLVVMAFVALAGFWRF